MWSGFPASAGFQFGAKLLDNTDIVGILIAVDHHKRMRIRLAEQVLRFINLIGCINGDKHGADLGSCPKGNKPLGDVGGPDGDMVACV